MKHLIIRNKNLSTEHDNAINALEGVYSELPDEVNNYKQSELPDGDIWLYPKDMSDEDIDADIHGYDVLARIHTVSDKED